MKPGTGAYFLAKSLEFTDTDLVILVNQIKAHKQTALAMKCTPVALPAAVGLSQIE